MITKGGGGAVTDVNVVCWVTLDGSGQCCGGEEEGGEGCEIHDGANDLDI